MASRRKGKEGEANGGAVEEMKGPKQTEEDRIRQLRKEHKLEYEQERKRRAETWRWIIVIVVLILAVIGLYCYFTYYQPKLPPAKPKLKSKPAAKPAAKSTTKPAESGHQTAGKQKGSKSTGKSGQKVSAKSSQSQSSTATKNGQTKATKPSKDAKVKGSPKDTKKSSKDVPGRKSYSIREGDTLREEIDLDKIPLLRRPIPRGDVDRPYIIEILSGDNLLRDKRYTDALEKFNEILKMFPQSPRAIYGKAQALENLARKKKSNKLLDTAIEFYKKSGLESILAYGDLKSAALLRYADLSQERGRHDDALKALEKLHEIQSENSGFANKLGLGYLTAGNLDKAKVHFEQLIEESPSNYFAKAHLGFILFAEKRFEEALPLLLEGIRKEPSVQSNAKFYLYAGESLMRLSRTEEAFALYGEAVSRDLLPSVWQRSLYNEPDLRATPWWTIEDTGYSSDLRRIADALGNITEEAMSVLIRGTGKFWGNTRHFSLYSKGKKDADNCRRVPRTCAIIESFPEASSCKRCEVKFTALPSRIHILPHVGPTNTILEVLVGLETGEGVRVRAAEETRMLTSGEILILDDSFEQELWNEDSETSVVLTMNVWHPDLGTERWRKLRTL